MAAYLLTIFSRLPSRLAKKATNNGHPASTQASLTYLKHMDREKMKKEWRQWWGSISQKGREYYGTYA